MLKYKGEIKLEFAAIIAECFVTSYKDGFQRLQVRQTVSSYYPKQAVSNGFSDNLFSLGNGDEQYGDPYKNDRVAWIMIPAGVTLEEAQAELDKHPEASINRRLSMQPVLTSQQEYGISQGLTSREDYENSQMVRNSDDEAVLYKNRHFYRINAFSTEYKEDTDSRDKQLKLMGDLPAEAVAPVPAPKAKVITLEADVPAEGTTDDLPF